MDDSAATLKEKFEKLLKEAAEVSVSLDQINGTIKGVPHYSVIEARAHELGRQLSREIQVRQMGEVAALGAETAPCPDCGTRCKLHSKKRSVTSIDGPIEIQELKGECPLCRRAFFPRQSGLGV
jgi:DNA repair exonuclease SbcCD ATPase subunit